MHARCPTVCAEYYERLAIEQDAVRGARSSTGTKVLGELVLARVVSGPEGVRGLVDNLDFTGLGGELHDA